ncbi:MAG: DUF5666 domain-containing protein [Oleibacter sp.]|nr:DUF5666 domain-containing protein [Thalassolituus sp.]
MNNLNIKRFSTLVVLSSGLLVACGGSNSSSDSAASASSSRAVEGTVDGFGSVIVDGVHYDSTNTEFYIDDRSGSESQLRVGQRVTVEGMDDGANGVALAIHYDVEVQGMISSIDVANGTITLLNQTVVIDGMTNFENGISIDTLAVGNNIQVSGMRDSEGQIRASFIGFDDSSDVEVRGRISVLDSVNMTFEVYGQSVNYSTASNIEIKDVQLSDNMLVEVEGVLNSSGVLVATRVHQENQLHQRSGVAKVVGVISAVDLNAGTLRVADVEVAFTNQTRFEHGNVIQLTLDARIKVKGNFTSEGILVAEKIEFEEPVKLEVEGPVDAVSDSSIIVMGITATVDTFTRVRDDRDDEKYFNLNEVQAGDFVELRLAINTDGSYRALKLERDDSEGRVKLTAPVDSIDVANGLITVLGIQVDVSGVSGFDIATLLVDGYIEVKGSYDGSRVTATSLSNDNRYEGDHNGRRHDDSEDDDSEDDDSINDNSDDENDD